MNYEAILEILSFTAKYELNGFLSWETSGEYAPVTFWVNTSDVLFWGASDGEELNAETLPVFKTCVEDCMAIDDVLGGVEATMLFACRINKCRPQGASYPENRDLWSLFDACGPEREIGFGNPYEPG